jgi:DNA invertase Pin-like site-specific DNA recombinase
VCYYIHWITLACNLTTAGVYKGRAPSIEASRVRELKAQGMRPTDIAKALKIGRASVYRVLGQPATGRRA